MSYLEKYLKYKSKYLELRNRESQEGGLGGRVYAYFLTEDDLKKFAQNHTFAVIGSQVKGSLLKSYPYIERKDDILYNNQVKNKIVLEEPKKNTTGLDVERKSLLQKVGDKLSKSNKFYFEYANLDKVKKVLSHQSMKGKTYKYIVIVRHYTVLKDAYCGTLIINDDSIDFVQIKYTRKDNETMVSYPNLPFNITTTSAEKQEDASA
jgi:hypothetical protein